MADNFPTAPGAGGVTFASDDIGGVHYPRTKLTFGADGEAADVSPAAPLPVSEASAAAILAAIQNLLSATALEDTPSPGGERGMVMLAQRRDSDTATTSGDGDYATMKMDEAGRLKTASQPAKYALVTGNISASGQTVFCQCDRGSNVIAHVVAAPSFAGHNVTFEGSIDSTNGVDGAWFAIDAKRTNANVVELVTGALAATPAYAWELSVNGFNFIRVRATAHTSGTATWKFQQAPYATEPVPVSQVTGTQPVAGTVTATVTPPAPATPFILNSAASTNAALILTGTSGLQAFYATNTGATPVYVKLYNKATAPVVGTDVPAMILVVPAAVSGVPGVCTLPIGFSGFRFALGLGIGITGGAADADTTAVAAGQVKVILSRTV